MTHALIASNPFALLMNPELIFAAIEKSDRLSRLKSQICRPLDKPATIRPDASDRPSAADDVDAWLAAQASRLGDC